MIYLYFENWTQPIFMSELDRKGYSHGDKIIKVFAAPFDPRARLGNPNLKVIESDDSPLTSLEFSYYDRGTFHGDEIEARIAAFDPYARRAIRGLFRFDNRTDLGFSQEGMHMKKGEEWLISHPLEDIDGLKFLPGNSPCRIAGIHLDIFEERSLKILSGILDTTPGSPEMLDMMKGKGLRDEVTAEISGRGGERK